MGNYGQYQDEGNIEFGHQSMNAIEWRKVDIFSELLKANTKEIN